MCPPLEGYPVCKRPLVLQVLLGTTPSFSLDVHSVSVRTASAFLHHSRNARSSWPSAACSFIRLRHAPCCRVHRRLIRCRVKGIRRLPHVTHRRSSTDSAPGPPCHRRHTRTISRDPTHLERCCLQCVCHRSCYGHDSFSLTHDCLLYDRSLTDTLTDC